MLLCGIPHVTLEGEKKDWEKILERLEKLKEYGAQSNAWYHLLVPIVSRFVKAFDEPNGKENIDFWQKVAHYQGGGSGPKWVSGWITAFCVFDAKGKWLGDKFEENRKAEVDHFLLIESFKTHTIKPQRPVKTERPKAKEKSLTLDKTTYPHIDTNDIPAGFAEVDVKVDDHGEEFDCVLTAGLVGILVRDSKKVRGVKVDGSGVRDVLSPVVGWWMTEKPQ